MGKLYLHSKIIEKISSYSSITWVEIGVRFGFNSEYILNNFDVEKIYLIDPYCELPYRKDIFSKDQVQSYERQAHKRLEKFKSKCTWFKDYSQNVCNKIDNESIDILYIDGDHHYNAVSQDLSMYYPKVKKNGLIIGDDYNEIGVSNAIKDFSKTHNISFQTSHDETSKFWFIK